jgi:hypothetical protein
VRRIKRLFGKTTIYRMVLLARLLLLPFCAIEARSVRALNHNQFPGQAVAKPSAHTASKPSSEEEALLEREALQSRQYTPSNGGSHGSRTRCLVPHHPTANTGRRP